MPWACGTLLEPPSTLLGHHRRWRRWQRERRGGGRGQRPRRKGEKRRRAGKWRGRRKEGRWRHRQKCCWVCADTKFRFLCAHPVSLFFTKRKKYPEILKFPQNCLLSVPGREKASTSSLCSLFLFRTAFRAANGRSGERGKEGTREQKGKRIKRDAFPIFPFPSLALPPRPSKRQVYVRVFSFSMC